MAARARGLGLLRGGLAGLPALGPAERRDSIFQRMKLLHRVFKTAVFQKQMARPVSEGTSGHEAIIISGTEMAKQIQKEIQRGVESWISLGNRRPHLSIILVGDNPASHMYVRNKIRAACTVGICSELILKPKSVSQEELLDITDQLNMDPRVSGILVQLPLPDHVDERTVCNGITPEKDVDGFHIINIGRLCLDQHSLIPATASAVWEIIKRTGIETFGKNVVVAGRSKNVGMPIAMLLHTDGDHERPGGDATVTIAHRYTPKEQLKIHTQLADIIIVAADPISALPCPALAQGGWLLRTVLPELPCCWFLAVFGTTRRSEGEGEHCHFWISRYDSPQTHMNTHRQKNKDGRKNTT
ncbi:bifunctional methylenetetrahydrofolate dehydrogenase/cyclohydrolase 2, mitochondrial isoform X15 [Elephas maximus indicus]|uniref:bifunctional methylenetetrahydrofolate dehydrogenase/cyclohydrolase 2, mitochondrial isoform X15 n=1 Tax=Elephas maximus indicus TaxID=99487 RepID=UPI002116A46D|nr:bifunctional methylenetetrahydrofolate dehydrogenase/cyclohydrolase 2, mitochondrial isoform X15 [Elephas maximus indicus]